MFERFDESARTVVVTAQEEARVLRHGAIGGEHLVLGITKEDPVLLNLGGP
jgi:ATP-dependent Clp protease ATP-binding subunit ClpC